jgi:hypothetical protein
MFIRMTSRAPKISALLVATAIASAAVLDAGAAGPADPPAPTALVIDAALSSDGRELVDPRLRDVDADVRLPRTPSEARTNVRYFDQLGYRVIVAGPDASAAAGVAGVDAERATDLPQALDAAKR